MLRRFLLRRAPARPYPILAALALFGAACDADRPTGVDQAGASASSLLGSQKTVVVGFTTAPGPAQLAAITSVGGTVTHRYRYIPAVVAEIPPGQQSVLTAMAGIAYVEDNVTMVPLGGRQIVDYGVSLIEAPAAWSLGTAGQDVKVGIFDSGIALGHPDLPVSGGIDLVGDGNGLSDCNGHGTHVAGITGARNNGHHTVGVAPKSELYSMRFADCAWAGATLAKMIEAVEWAIDNQMDVVNMSFGFGLAGLVSSPLPPSQAAEDAFAAAYHAGIVLVAASGNSSTPYVGYPASSPWVIAVGATDDADLIASFSQTGTDQEVTAPGVNNLASYIPGQGVETALFVNTDGDRELEAIGLAFAGMTKKKGITADAVYVGFGTPVEFEAVDCTGRNAVVSRGGTSFAEKAVAAMDAGCATLVIHNHTPGNFNGTLGTATAPDGRAWIPVVSITLEDGLYLRDQIQTRPTRTTVVNAPGNLAILSGTSMASPHAAGVVALILSRNPGLTPDQVRAVLQTSSDDLGTPGWDPVFGYGRVNARKAVLGAN